MRLYTIKDLVDILDIPYHLIYSRTKLLKLGRKKGTQFVLTENEKELLREYIPKSKTPKYDHPYKNITRGVAINLGS